MQNNSLNFKEEGILKVIFSQPQLALRLILKAITQAKGSFLIAVVLNQEQMASNIDTTLANEL